MFSTLAKIWHHTTKNSKTGEYSQKRLMSWGAYFFAMFLSMADVVNMNLWPEQSFSMIRPNVDILWVWVTIALGTTILTVIGKVKSITNGLSNITTTQDNG